MDKKLLHISLTGARKIAPRKIAPSPNSSANPKPNSDPDGGGWGGGGAIFLGGNFPDTSLTKFNKLNLKRSLKTNRK